MLDLLELRERIERDVEEVVKSIEREEHSKCTPLLEMHEFSVYIELVIGEDYDRRTRVWVRKHRVTHEIVNLVYRGNIDWHFGEKHIIWIEGRENIACYFLVRVNGEIIANDIMEYAARLEEGKEEEPRRELEEEEGS